jgi:beta-lactamase class A
MTPSLIRRHLLLALGSLPLATRANTLAARADFAVLERDLHGELGVAAIDSATGHVVGHRQDQRFPMCSTFKAVLVAAVLARVKGMPIC